MDMQYGLLAGQTHHERIERALEPRPEPYGHLVPTPKLADAHVTGLAQ
jgi:hypothetical protein